jgi:hypothetical protein
VAGADRVEGVQIQLLDLFAHGDGSARLLSAKCLKGMNGENADAEEAEQGRSFEHRSISSF